MTAGVPRYERKSIGWVLDRAQSCFVPVIQRRIRAGEKVTARIFSVQGRRFAQVQFADLSLVDLILPLGASR